MFSDIIRLVSTQKKILKCVNKNERNVSSGKCWVFGKNDQQKKIISCLNEAYQLCEAC